MKTSQKGIDLIKRYEGFSAVPYFCPANYLTIGYGHVILKNEKYTKITESMAENILAKDLVRFENAVLDMTKVKLNQNQFDALISFCYNLGPGAYQRSSLRSKLNREEYFDASLEFLKWIYAGGRKLNGLIIRRQAERSLFLS